MTNVKDRPEGDSVSQLIEWLRAGMPSALDCEAADALEELSEELDQAYEKIRFLNSGRQQIQKIEQLEAELAEAYKKLEKANSGQLYIPKMERDNAVRELEKALAEERRKREEAERREFELLKVWRKDHGACDALFMAAREVAADWLYAHRRSIGINKDRQSALEDVDKEIAAKMKEKAAK